MLRVAKLTDASGERAADQGQEPVGRRPDGHRRAPAEVGDSVSVELSSQKIPATVVWTRDDLVGFKFDQNVDLGELLAGRKPRHGFRAAPAAAGNPVQGVGPASARSITPSTCTTFRSAG